MTNEVVVGKASLYKTCDEACTLSILSINTPKNQLAHINNNKTIFRFIG